MPAAASRDLRERAANSYLRGDGTYEEVAEQFAIGTASLRRWVRRMRERGHVEPDGHSGGRASKVPDDALMELRAFVGEDADRTVPEITAQWCRRRGGAARLHRRVGLQHRDDARTRMGATRRARDGVSADELGRQHHVDRSRPHHRPRGATPDEGSDEDARFSRLRCARLDSEAA